MADSPTHVAGHRQESSQGISITRTGSPARQNVLFGAAGRGYADRLGLAPSGGYSTSRSEANWPQSVTRFQQAPAHLPLSPPPSYTT